MLFTITLNQNKEFLRLYRKGKTISSKACIFYFIQNNCPFNRIGLTTSKKVGNAVCRNRARRVMRAAYIENEKDFPIGFDIVIVARKYASEAKSTEISNFFNTKVIKEMQKFNKNENGQKSKKG